MAGRPTEVPHETTRRYKPRVVKKPWSPHKLVSDEEFLMNLYMIFVYSETKAKPIKSVEINT